MKSLSQSEYGKLRSLYQQVYTSTDEIVIDDLSEEVVGEIFDELVREYVLEGYEIEQVLSLVEEAVLTFIEAKVTYGSDTESPEQRRERAKAKVGEKKAAARKAAVKTAVGRAKAKATGAKAMVGIAGSIAKDEARRAGRAAKQAVSGAVQKKKAEVKSGVKSLIGKGLRKAAGAVGKVASKASGAAARLGEELEELQASGLFTEQELASFSKVEEAYKEIDREKHGRMYDRYKKLRTAAMKDARETGEASGDNRMKMGKMSDVLDKSAENLRKKG